uniref:Uncharacterized protein n=1 Tax=Sexangularia sp. CB-2014 TaxID=1486929 RepID=A0A6U0JTG2_9EUKA|mmetsp:Transcript_7926/g.25350  ORF Transcript_7926/g.25350 Transcript_7926/m.25350 type:complete len:150 (+) Transcript_7926:134-583(+)
MSLEPDGPFSSRVYRTIDDVKESVRAARGDSSADGGQVHRADVILQACSMHIRREAARLRPYRRDEARKACALQEAKLASCWAELKDKGALGGWKTVLGGAAGLCVDESRDVWSCMGQAKQTFRANEARWIMGETEQVRDLLRRDGYEL